MYGTLNDLVVNAVDDKIVDDISDDDFPDVIRMDSLFLIPFLDSTENISSPLSSRRISRRILHTNSNWATAVTLVKGMIGVFVLYLPFLFSKAGVALGIFFTLLFAILSTWTMLMISECSDLLGFQHFGEIGERAVNSVWGRRLVDISILLSQLGYCISYYTYISSNLLSFPSISRVVSKYTLSNIGLTNDITLIILQVLLYIPLSWVRRISHLSKTLIFANIFIFTGVFITYGYNIFVLVSEGPKPVEIIDFSGLALFLSSTVIAFEGMGVVLPIKHSMANPKAFAPVLSSVMCFLGILFASFSAITYYSYGENVQRFATMNLPQSSIGNFVKLSYCAAILLTYPLQLYPAIHIIEHSLFTYTKKNIHNTILKNLGRSFVVVLTAVVAVNISAKRFDYLMSLIGSLCVVPLSFIYPPLFHIIICCEQKRLSAFTIIAEVALLLLGVGIMIFCTGYTLAAFK